MGAERKYILGLDQSTIQFMVYELEAGIIPTWMGFEECSATALYGQIRKDRDFIYNMSIAYGDHGVHVLWDDLEGSSCHFLLTSQEWNQFLYFATLKRVESGGSVNWLKEGF